MSINSKSAINVLGIRVDNVSQQDIHWRILDSVRNNSKIIVGNVNIHAMNLAFSTPWFRDFLNNCETCFCDGYGVKLGARLLGYHLKERITYADWVWELGEFCQENEISIFFLGAHPGIAQKAAKKIIKKYPQVIISGTQDGYFDKDQKGEENRRLIEVINRAKPDILIVGMGMPLQERWLRENWDQLDVKVGLTGGAVFDYVSGELRRAPKWMTDHGFEWLGRFFIEPRRLWKRYLIGNPLFILRVFLHRLGLLKFPDINLVE